MAKNWNGVFSRSTESDYSQLPTQDSSSPADDFNTWPRVDSRNVAVERPGNEGALDLSARPASARLPYGGRHTVQIGAMGQLESQVPLTEGIQLKEEYLSAEKAKIEKLEKAIEAGTVKSNELSAFIKSVEDDIASNKKALAEAIQERDRKASLEAEKTEDVEVPTENQKTCWRFVEQSWYQAISAVVIITNIITTIVEMDKPWTKDIFFISDQVMLVFYVVELYSRSTYFGHLFLCGPAKSVCWNVLDIIVVFSGVLDQWLMPMLPGANGGVCEKILHLLRLLRLLRVFKIIRVFLDIDLSWTEAPAFQSFIGIVIFINSLLMGMEIDIPWCGWFYFEQVLLCIYVFELSIRLKNLGLFFFSCNNADIVWNILDFIIVTSSTLDSWITPLCGVIMKSIAGDSGNHKKQTGMSLGKVMMLMRMLRLMRILRLAKLVKSVRPLFVLVTGVAAACQGVAWVLVLTIVILYAMGILATSLIGKKMAFPPGADLPAEVLEPFSTVPDSMFTLFRVMSGVASDEEAAAIDSLMADIPSIKLGFVFFMISSSWTLLSILTAVVSENMISTTGQQEEEHKLANAEEDRLEHVQKLREVFSNIDQSGDGDVDKSEIDIFLRDKANAVKTARFCRVPIRDVREVLQTVTEACEGNKLSLETFVECLADVGNGVTEKSVMKIEAKLTNIARHQLESEAKLTEMLKNIHSKSKDNAASKLEKAAEATSKVWQDRAEAACKSQLQEVGRFMQGFADKTEARLNELLEKNERLMENMTGALEQSLPGADKLSDMLEVQLRKMQQELLGSLKGKESNGSKVKDDPEVAGFAIASSAAGPAETSKRENDKQPAVASENQTDVADTAKAPSAQMEQVAIQVEARVLAIEESIRGLQQEAEYQRLSALAVDKFSETMESEFRMMRQELPGGCGRQSPYFPTWRDTVETRADRARASSSGQTEARLLATKESIHGLQQKTEAMLRKIQGLLDKAVDQASSSSASAAGKPPETLERELRMLRQELLSNLASQDPEVAKARDGLLPKGTGPKKRAHHEEVPMVYEGKVGSPRCAAEREE